MGVGVRTAYGHDTVSWAHIRRFRCGTYTEGLGVYGRQLKPYCHITETPQYTQASSVTASLLAIKETKNLAVRRHDVLQVHVQKIVERVDVLLLQPTHAQKGGEKAPFFLIPGI
jgi:hypothetical protein